MNERNTNRRAQTPGNRTTQRHQIDGRPAPRRQASHASDYSEGSFTQTSRSNTFRTGPRQSAQSSRPRQQQDRRQQPPQRGQQRPSQRRASSRRTTPSSRRTNRTPIHEQHSYQTLTPRQGTSTYVRHGYSKKRSNLPFFVGGAAALVVVIFSCDHPGRSSWRLEPKHSRRDACCHRCGANAHYAYGYIRWRLHLGNRC